MGYDMTTSIILTEQVKPPVKSQDDMWLVTVAVPGQGSSGYYSEELLQEDGPGALHPGAQSFLTHDAERNPKDMIGVFPEGAFWNEEKKVLQAKLKVFPHYKEMVETLAPHVGMSLRMQGKKDKEGNITHLLPYRGNSCDLVSQPGLEGSGIDEKLYESLRDKALKDAEQDTQVEALEKKIDGLVTAFEAYVAAQTKLKEGDGGPTPEEMVAEAVEKFDAAVALIEEADLLPSQATDLRERARKGEDVTSAVETAKAIKDEMVEQFKATQESLKGVGNIGGVQVESARDLGKVFD